MKIGEFVLTSRFIWTDVTLKLPYWTQYGFKIYWANSYSSLHLHFLIVRSDTLKCVLCSDHSFHILQPVQCLYKYYSCDFSPIKANEEWHPISLWKHHKFLSHTLNSLFSNQNLEDKRFFSTWNWHSLVIPPKWYHFAFFPADYLEVTSRW